MILAMWSGCPAGHNIHNQTSEADENILTDSCSEEDDNHWLAPQEAVNDDAEIIIDMGCLKKIKGLQMKNLKKEHGGTKRFTILLSEFQGGPWKSIWTDELTEQHLTGCGLIQSFNLAYEFSYLYAYLLLFLGIIELQVAF